MSLVLVLFLACGGGDDSGFAWPDGGGDAGSGDAGSGDAGGDGGGTTGDQALLRAVGQATVGDPGFSGTERLLLLPKGQSDEAASLCTISVTLTQAGERSDCGECVWAYDLLASDPQVEVDGRCDDAGLDADSVVGVPRAYGYAEEYIGHSSVLMVELDGLWQGITYATWDEDSGALSYDWDQDWIELP